MSIPAVRATVLLMETHIDTGTSVKTTEPLGGEKGGEVVTVPGGTHATVIGESEIHPGNWDLRTSDNTVLPFVDERQFRIIR